MIAAIASLSACVVEADLTTTEQESHSWGGYHWARTANPFILDVGDNVSIAWDAYLGTTITDWSQSTVLDLVAVAGGARNKSCKGVSGRVEVCSSKYGRTGWLGVASIWLQGSHITQGTVKLNDTYFVTATYNTGAWRNLVTCQEVGHALGLDHQDENFDNTPLGTCMDYSNDPTPNQHPNQHDYDELELIYAHLDDTTKVGTSTQSLGEPGVSPADWGQRVWSDGTEAVYVRELGGDHRIVTFVTWADEP